MLFSVTLYRNGVIRAAAERDKLMLLADALRTIADALDAGQLQLGTIDPGPMFG